MDFFDTNSHLAKDYMGTNSGCSTDLTDMLTVANISQGMDPLQAALDAQLQAPLVQPFLF